MVFRPSSLALRVGVGIGEECQSSSPVSEISNNERSPYVGRSQSPFPVGGWAT
jgi:hypothetical protein